MKPLATSRVVLLLLVPSACAYETTPLTERTGKAPPMTDGSRPSEGTAPPASSPSSPSPGGASPGSSASTPGVTAPSARGIFVAVGYGARRVRSRDDGATWDADQSDVANGGDDEHLIRDVAWGGGAWVTAAGFNGRIKTSADAAAWMTESSSAGQWFGGLAFDGGTWIGVGGYGRRSRSTDGGKTWTDVRDEGAPNGFRALALGRFQNQARWVGVGDGGRVTYTSDGQTWGTGQGVSAGGLGDVAFGGGVFVALPGDNRAFRSTDGGATWSAIALPVAVRTLTFGASTFVAVGSGVVLTSADGTTWARRDAPGLGGPVTFGNGVFLTMANGRAHVSPDGQVWTARGQLPAGANAIERVRFGG